MDDYHSLDKQDLEREYSPSSLGKDFVASVAAYRTRSDAALEALAWTHVPYGANADEIVVLAGDPVTADHLHLFIHGGYWQELSWRDSLFPAPGFADAGILFGAINYTLAPAATLDQIVDQCRRAILAVVRVAGRKGRPPRITLSGSSAGAHLAAMMAMTDWRSMGVGANPVSGVVLLSGIYALRPLILTSINKPLGLTASDAERLSPLVVPVPPRIPALIAWGEFETGAFKSQSVKFANHWRNGGNRVEALEVKGRSHFDIVFDMADRKSALGARTFAILSNNGGGIDVV